MFFSGLGYLGLGFRLKGVYGFRIELDVLSISEVVDDCLCG